MLAFIFCTLLAIMPAQNRHDYHSCLTEIQYNQKNQTIEVSIRVFTDDLEKALAKHFKLEKVTIDKTKAYQTQIETYIQKHFKVRNKNKDLIKGTYIGKDFENDATMIYIEFSAQKITAQWQVANSIFTDIYYDQTNIVNTFYKTQKSTLLFTKSTNWLELGF